MHARHLVVPFVIEGVLFEAPRIPAVHYFAHVYQKRLAGVSLVRTLGREGILDPVVRPGHIKSCAPTDLDLSPVVVSQLVPYTSSR